ncbi:MAG TPA: HAMP domain-containing sensor histidine kinase [Balneolaceae bacterium]|nr:HAMP domain-containing sensor histidine kinase [Balneolaceae bacterium]
MKRYESLRWILLAAGVFAILGLTGMNVYSLYALHENTLASDRKNKKLQIAEFSDRLRYRFYKPYYGLGSVDIERLKNHFEKTGQFTDDVKELLKKAADDAIYTDIYFIPSGSNVCQSEAPILKYHAGKNKFVRAPFYPAVVCDGTGIARTQVKSLLEHYRYNNKIIFDAHRSISIALINAPEHSIFGYLTMPFNQHFLIEYYLPKKLVEKFGDSGMTVWLRDWTHDTILAGSDTSSTYQRDKIQFVQNFPDFFDYWQLEVSFAGAPAVAASNASFVKNLIVLATAVLLLLGALVFMFISARQERALAQRQAGFLANVTHELKTPIAVMQAAGENLADGRVKNPERLKSYGTHIYKEAIRLRRMIKKLLDIAKADAGQALIDPEVANIKDLVQSYIEDHQSYIENKGFLLQTTLSLTEQMVMVDIDSFNTISSNLVENAIKYSTHEKYLGITLSSNKSEVLLQVEDHGIGMTQKDILHIFDKFYRVEDSLTAQTKGHGLGLSIVKNLVELNEGRIEVASTPGKGSIFTVAFPVFNESTEASLQKIHSISSQIISEPFKKEKYVR